MKIFVTDFDGTMTRRDFYRVAQARLVPPGTPDYWEDYLAGRMTHFEALRAIFRHIRGNEEEVLAAAREMELDPRAGAAIARLQEAGWEVRIASAGCHWYIDRLLAGQDIRVTVHANPGVYDPREGLLMTPPVDSPYYSPPTGIDKLAVVRDAVKEAAESAFAGDGPPDLEPSLLVSPHDRFARGYLAKALRARGESFNHYDCWSEIADILAGG